MKQTAYAWEIIDMQTNSTQIVTDVFKMNMMAGNPQYKVEPLFKKDHVFRGKPIAWVVSCSKVGDELYTNLSSAEADAYDEDGCFEQNTVSVKPLYTC